MNFLNLPIPPAWITKAACGPDETDKPVRDDADEWHPHDASRADEARKVCRRCPVKNECLAYALDNPELTGIWGDTNASERRRMRRDATAVVHG